MLCNTFTGGEGVCRLPCACLSDVVSALGAPQGVAQHQQQWSGPQQPPAKDPVSYIKTPSRQWLIQAQGHQQDHSVKLDKLSACNAVQCCSGMRSSGRLNDHCSSNWPLSRGQAAVPGGGH